MRLDFLVDMELMEYNMVTILRKFIAYLFQEEVLF